jgi:GH15 family glucan-1,4-alpha-glucosidase
MASKIEDYAIIGDCETAAWSSGNGAIDWLCWGRAAPIARPPSPL